MTTGPWTDAELDTLKLLISEKLSAAVIAERMGRPRNGVIGATHRYRERVGGLRWWAVEQKRSLKIKTVRTVKKRQIIKKVPESKLEFAMETKEAKDIAVEAVPVWQLRTLMELEADQCRWPVGDMFCGDHVESGSYCPSHTEKSHMYKRK